MWFDHTSRWVAAAPAMACVILLAAGIQVAGADDRSLQAELVHDYRLATAAIAADGSPAIQPGTVLTVLREGIVGYAQSDQSLEDLCPAQFSGGQLRRAANVLCSLDTHLGKRVFQVSDRVCVTSISVSEQVDLVSMYLVACDRGHATLARQAYYALVNFQFAKGTLRSASAAEVEAAVSQVLSAGETKSPGVLADRSAADNRNSAAGEAGSAAPPNAASQPASPEAPRNTPGTPSSAVPEPTVPPLEPLPTPAKQPEDTPSAPEAGAQPHTAVRPETPAPSAAAPATPDQTIPPLEPLPVPANQPEAAPAASGTEPQPQTAERPDTSALTPDPKLHGANVPEAQAPSSPRPASSGTPTTNGQSSPEQSVPPLDPLPAKPEKPAAKVPVANGPVSADPSGQAQVNKPATRPRKGKTNDTSARSKADIEPASAPPVQRVKKGQTAAEVKAVLGDPAKVVNDGLQITYVYHHGLKVILRNGRVTEIQQDENN